MPDAVTADLGTYASRFRHYWRWRVHYEEALDVGEDTMKVDTVSRLFDAQLTPCRDVLLSI
jgi:hypothetical protein